MPCGHVKLVLFKVKPASLCIGGLCKRHTMLWVRYNDYRPSLMSPMSLFSTNSVSMAKHSKKEMIVPITFTKKSSTKKEVVEIYSGMTVAQLAAALKRDIGVVSEALEIVPGLTQNFEPKSAIYNLEILKKVVEICGCKFRLLPSSSVKKDESSVNEDKNVYRRPLPDPSKLVKRPPVVTIMGHVDHGKTTLLDAFRHSNRVSEEFGGITQHIGAFSVELNSGSNDTITFLDTPGHAAFASMRARGASVTDIVVLVVAADDGVMKQTVESIHCSREAGVSMIIAINKIDKPNADIDKTKRELLQHNIPLEEFGGTIQAVPISALKGLNLDELQEAILAEAEMLELKADPSGFVEGVVIESRTDPGRGKLSTALVQRGMLKKGNILVAGTAWAKVRGMFNDKGKPIETVGPGRPVEIIGWRELPGAGEDILQVESEHRAKEVVAYREKKLLEDKTSKDLEVIRQKAAEHEAVYQEARRKRLESGLRFGSVTKMMAPQVEQDNSAQLAIIVKGDVDGSVEAILDVLDTYDCHDCKLHLLGYGVGAISEHDVELASMFNGVIYGFNVNANEKAAALAKSSRVDIRQHNVIYKLIDDLKDELSNKLPTIEVEEIVGEANVLQNFTITEGKRKISVAGCRCTKGVLHKKKYFKLVRNDQILLEGELSSLKHFKTEVDIVKTDVECGLSFTDQSVCPLPGDQIICYELKEKKLTLNWDLNF